ncbi:hypothetical protein ACFLSE_08265, partial [Bacteroidota bacterium]
MNLRFLYLASLLSFIILGAYSQEPTEDLPKIFYRNEKTLGIQLNTNGWGIGYRYGDRINYFEKRIYEIDFS